jgi:hypothetical protein
MPQAAAITVEDAPSAAPMRTGTRDNRAKPRRVACHHNDANRSLALSALAPLARVHVSFVSLQKALCTWTRPMPG